MSEPEPASPGSREESEATAGPAEEPAKRPPARRWDPGAAFRESFLCHYLGRGRDAAVLRRIGQLFYDAALEVPSAGWNTWDVRVQLRGVLADLRHLEGCCKSLAEYEGTIKLTPRERRFCRFAGELTAALGELADRLAQELDTRRSRRS